MDYKFVGNLSLDTSNQLVSIYSKDVFLYAFYKSFLQSPLPSLVNISFVAAKSFDSLKIVVSGLLRRNFVFTSLEEYEVYEEHLLFHYRRVVRGKSHFIRYGIVFSEDSIY